MAMFARADLSGASLREAAAPNSNFMGAKLLGTDFRGARLDTSCWEKADASAARFDGADLSYSLMPYVKLNGASLTRVRFANTDLHAVESDGALFTGTSGSTRGTDAERAISDLYNPLRVAPSPSGVR
jgi:uncharacterized protein YjbI with pentapeptide repeats